MQPTRPRELETTDRRADPGSSPPALALGAGITLLGVVRTLGRRHVTTLTLADERSPARSSRWFRPAPGVDAGESGGRTLEDYLAATPLERAVLLPCSDEWSRQVAALDPALARRFPASAASPDLQDTLVDKARFARLLRERGAPHPRTVILSEGAGLEDLEETSLADCFLKPRDSQAFFRRFGVKAFRPGSREALEQRLEELTAEGFGMIVQEYVPGPASNHYFVDGFLDRTGQVRARLVRRRLRMYPTDFGNSSYMRTVPAEEAGSAVETIEGLLTAVGFRGIYSAEFKRDERDGVFRLLEVNARPWWYVEFAARCGVDVVWMAYLDALERPVPNQLEYELDRALVFPRYDLFACIEGLRAGELTWSACLRSWVGGDRPIFSWDDPLPALREALRNTRGSLGRRVRPPRRGNRP